MIAAPPDLDLRFPTLQEPVLPRSQLTAEQYGDWIESVHEGMRQDGTVERLIATRPCPLEEIFVLK